MHPNVTEALRPGMLYLVATPIGNLEDITLRALRTLKEADLIACEDTRQTRKLLNHYAIVKPLVSYHEHNEAARTAELLGEMRRGRSVALVSDAGMPLVSDPGYRLVRAAIENGTRVEALPGACAAVTALAASGMPTGSFCFAGFLPAKSGQRLKFLEALANQPGTLIFYEAPHRILETLRDIEQVMGERPVVVARELTKIHEEFLRGAASEVRAKLAARDTIRGEITLLVGRPAEPPANDTPAADAVAARIAQGMSRMDAIKTVAKERGVPKGEIYRALEHHKT